MALVTLVSGGLDSTVMSVMAQEAGVKTFPLFIDYGQLAAGKEWEACQRVHRQFSLPSVTYMDLSGFGRAISSGITDSSWRLAEDAFLPGRNLMFVVAGAAHAFRVGADRVAIGLLDPEYHLFPDQTREFVEGCEEMVARAMGKSISIVAPLFEFSKADVVFIARDRGVSHTYSCHAGRDEPCGTCVACVEFDAVGSGA